MTDTVADVEVCRACGGTREEHANSMHAFTLVSGELLTKRQMDEKLTKGQGIRVASPPPIPHMETSGPVMDRLMSTLLDKGLIDTQEALYILLGRSPK